MPFIEADTNAEISLGDTVKLEKTEVRFLGILLHNENVMRAIITPHLGVLPADGPDEIETVDLHQIGLTYIGDPL